MGVFKWLYCLLNANITSCRVVESFFRLECDRWTMMTWL